MQFTLSINKLGLLPTNFKFGVAINPSLRPLMCTSASFNGRVLRSFQWDVFCIFFAGNVH